jgi:hypothetical protein
MLLYTSISGLKSSLCPPFGRWSGDTTTALGYWNIILVETACITRQTKSIHSSHRQRRSWSPDQLPNIILRQTSFTDLCGSLSVPFGRWSGDTTTAIVFLEKLREGNSWSGDTTKDFDYRNENQLATAVPYLRGTKKRSPPGTFYI